ncbi:hypothetical protein BJ508DRAFT_314381 [Ascobolus immersus RN42]|uniref:Uncharacterized protein n=1 Tax=Ascobolus immersus RN42 TaxID=1160509 RepID=A0A3N4HF66_ASCIM|nr:hypothetical protein BJ508DRAFT_314381 [Ascobolus immersus RN42]
METYVPPFNSQVTNKYSNSMLKMQVIPNTRLSKAKSIAVKEKLGNPYVGKPNPVQLGKDYTRSIKLQIITDLTTGTSRNSTQLYRDTPYTSCQRTLHPNDTLKKYSVQASRQRQATRNPSRSKGSTSKYYNYTRYMEFYSNNGNAKPCMYQVKSPRMPVLHENGAARTTVQDCKDFTKQDENHRASRTIGSETCAAGFSDTISFPLAKFTLLLHLELGIPQVTFPSRHPYIYEEEHPNLRVLSKSPERLTKTTQERQILGMQDELKLSTTKRRIFY